MSGIRQSKIIRGTVLASRGGKGLRKRELGRSTQSLSLKRVKSSGIRQSKIIKGTVLAGQGGKGLICCIV